METIYHFRQSFFGSQDVFCDRTCDTGDPMAIFNWRLEQPSSDASIKPNFSN